MECEFPTINSNDQEIKNIFSEIKTIAVMGLSPNETKASHFVPKYMQEQGYKIYPVYPKEETILGEKVYRSLAEIPEAVDCVNIFRKPNACLPIVEEAIKRGDVKVVWLQKDIVNNEACELAVKNGIKAVQNRCLMVEHQRQQGD